MLTASETHADGSVAARGSSTSTAWRGRRSRSGRSRNRCRCGRPPPRGAARSRTSTCRPPRRLAALEGLVALGVDPGRWWFQRDWTDTGAPLHETIRVSYSKLSTLENCELQYVLSAELGLGGMVGYHAWVGKTVHKIIEDCENGTVGRSLAEMAAVVDERWRPQEFPSTAVSETWKRLAKETMLPNWFGTVRRASRDRHGAWVRVRVRRRDAERLHRPDRARPAGVRHAHHRLQDRAARTRPRRRTRACSSASTTWRRRRRRT